LKLGGFTHSPGKINTGSDHFRAFRYVLQEHKRATILETNIKGQKLNRAIIDGETIANSKPLIKELTRPFSQIRQLVPHIKNSVVHIKIGFDPQDGEVPGTTKVAVAYELLDHLGYYMTARLVVNHHRDDPSHKYAHDHDHIHVIASTINYSGYHIHDSYNFAKAEKASRLIETEYTLTPLVARVRREQTINIDKSPIIRPTLELIPHRYEHQEPTQERMGR
jgi:Relaxase/Mobilisation nuclease domain